MDADLTLRARASAEIKAAMLRWSAAPMTWGRDDCMLAVADVVRSLTGNDPARRFRGRYRSRTGALRLLGPAGAVKAVANIARALHGKRIKPALALPGDVGLVPIIVQNARGKPVQVYAAAICRGPGWFVGRREFGFAGFPANRIIVAWSIAC